MAEQKKISLRVLDGQTEFAEDEIQKLSEVVNTISKPLFYILLIAAVGYFGFNFYTDGQSKKQKAGSEQLSIVQGSFDELVKSKEALTVAKPEEKEKAQKDFSELKKKFREQVKTLADRAAPYSQLAATYQAFSDNLESENPEPSKARKEIIQKLITD